MNLRALAALTLLVCTSSTAFAKEMVGSSSPTFGEKPAKDYESSQWFALEFKFSPYSPHIDSSKGLKGTPFSDLFNPQGTYGQPPPRLLTQVEFDFQFLHKVGSLGVGVTAGYARRTTHSLDYVDLEGMSPCTIGHCIRSGDQTALNVMPFSVLAVYRFDYLAKRFNVPLVPYFKLGLAYYIWWVEDGTGATATFVPNKLMPKLNNDSGFGGTFGFVLNPGISFLLDILDQSAAKTMDAELGINHTYVFFELHYANVNNFGVGNKMDLSDTTYNCGIGFEF